MSHKKRVELFRVDKDQFMKNSPHSPIHDKNVRKKFERLDYYPIDERWNFRLKLNRYEEVEDIQMETSTGDIQNYKRIGFVEFQHPDTGEMVKVNIYQGGDHYTFIIRDLTSGEETYGAGRYLNIAINDDDTVDVDLNMLYNPFCAYSPNYSCPFPPLENWLNVKITAGEKNFPLYSMVYK